MITSLVVFATAAFVNFCENEKGKNLGLICYKNDGNRIIYADRFGHVYKMHIYEDKVCQQEITYPRPSRIVTDTETMNWLRGQAMNKRWKGGVAKLDNYAYDCSAEELDAAGIDPYFYAWMASKHYQSALTRGDIVEKSLDSQEYEDICNLVSIQCGVETDGEDLGFAIDGYLAAKADGHTFDEWVTGTCGNEDSENEMFKDISVLVNKHSNGSYELKKKIYDLISDYNVGCNC